MRRRLDVELVRRGLMPSRAQAAAAVEAGAVLVSGAVADKPARMVSPAEPVEVVAPPRFVSRGGRKLEAALEGFGIDVAGKRCLDAGASTGGFTDCMLQRGAREVVAVDVGKGQLDWRLRNDPRVRVMEGTHLRSLDSTDIGGQADVVTADLSFISLVAVAPALAALARDDADLVVLVKPQFEAGPKRLGKHGVVRDPQVHRDVLGQVRDGLATAGLGMVSAMPSPIRGASGNVEFLAHLRKDAGALVSDDILDEVVAAAHAASGTP